MYFSSDSWGRLGRNLNHSLEEYFQRYIQDKYENDSLEIEEIPFNSVIHDSAICIDSAIPQGVYEILSKASALSSKNIIKEVWEGLRMPVYNPKTGENDYVDINLVNKIVVDAEYLEDMIGSEKFKIDISLHGDAEKNEIYVKARNDKLNMEEIATLSLQSFEEMLFKAIHEIKSQRLEEVPEFRDTVYMLLEQFINRSWNEGKYYAHINKSYQWNQGIGIIRDTKTNQDVGTFESLEYTYERNRSIVHIYGILLVGRMFEDLADSNRFEFRYYSLEQQSIYSLVAGEKTTVALNAEQASIDIEKYQLAIDIFNEQHPSYSMVVSAQETKSLLEGLDKSSPLYETNNERYRSSRLLILEESKNKQKEEKLVQQFSDIDLDL